MLIDAYLKQLAHLLTVAPAKREEVIQEVHDHLDDDTNNLVATGLEREKAEEQAVAAFGISGDIAAKFNAIHPLYWDARRFWLRVLWAILVIWCVWILLIFPLLVHLATTHHYPYDQTIPTVWTLLFQASPISFGIFYVLMVDNLRWILPLLLLFYGIVPFFWARQAGSFIRQGLAFGLGFFFGLPWVLPSIIYFWEPWNPLMSMAPAFGLLLLILFTIFAGWLGKLSLRLHITLPKRRRNAPSNRIFGQKLSIILGGVIIIALIGINGWSFIRFTQWHPTTQDTGQQLTSAQAQLPFTIQQPTYIPANLTLYSVFYRPNSCLNPCTSLQYQDKNGAWLTLTEITTEPQLLNGPPVTSTYQFSEGNVTGYRATWWLGSETITEHQMSITWERGNIQFSLATNSISMTKDELLQIANSIHG